MWFFSPWNDCSHFSSDEETTMVWLYMYFQSMIPQTAGGFISRLVTNMKEMSLKTERNSYMWNNFFVHNLQFLLMPLFFCCVYKLNQLWKVQAHSLYSANICHFVLTARQMALPVGATIYQVGRVTIFIALGNLSWIVIFEGLTLLFKQAFYI